MTTTPADLSDLRPRRQIIDRLFKGSTLAAGALILLILALIAYTITGKSLPVFRAEGVDFFTERRWAPTKEIYGALSFIYGTAVTALLAVVISVPVSLGIALFTTQVAPPKLKKWLVSLTDLVAVVPSVVFGLWGIIFLAPKLAGTYKHVSAWFDGWPILGHVFGRTGAGRTFMTAGLILAVMITPIITSIAREVIETTPQTDRDGALALGATRWEMITGAVLPHSMTGIVGAVMLGLGRAMGETIAVALVIGSSPTITANLFSSGDSLPSVIAFQWGEATTDIKRSALIAMGLTLFVITIVVNLTATAVVNRATKRVQGT
ncbi:MAG TPA: phosphate ABC transporter permease subunit PstC [Ilumatobacteraceae bacterium]|nr:phosphate ABC transporter permease subunit PstC [Ilumatobacteraceae bacterium]